jgi:cytochrome c556
MMSLRALALGTVLLMVMSAVEAQAPAPSPEMQAAREAFRKACGDDAKNLCPDKQGREMFQCLRENNDKVSQSCKDAMAKFPRRPPAGAAPPQQQ